MKTTRTLTTLLLGSVATFALMGQAQALEADPFLDRVAAVFKHIGYEFTFGPGTVDGDSVTVDSVAVGLEGMTTMQFDTPVTFSGITEEADGTYYVDSVTIPDVDSEFTSDGVSGQVRVSDIEATGLYLPAGDVLAGADALQLVETVRTGALEVLREGEPFFSYDSAEAVSTFAPEQGPDLQSVNATFTVNGMTADLSSAETEDPQAFAVIDALDLTNLSGDIDFDMDWSLDDGAFSINQFLVDFADVGAINLSAEMTGLTRDLLDQYYQMQAQMMAGSTEMTEEQSQTMMMQSMALAQGVNIVGASIRYDDASLGGKLLAYFASQNGTDRATFVEGLKASLPALVAQTGITPLTDLVVPPVTAFLDDPQSLEVRIAPPSPTSVLVLAAAAANPAGLIAALGLAVEANTAAAE